MMQDDAQLTELAEAYGVQTSYEDVRRVRRSASREAILRVLRELGAAVDSARHLQRALWKRRCELAFRGIEPVIVAWDGKPAEFELTLPKESGSTASCLLMGESVMVATEWQCELKDGREMRIECDGHRRDFVTYRMRLPDWLSIGFNELTVTIGGESQRTYRSCVISAPSRVYCPENNSERIWGGFLPLYAVRTERNWGAGDFTDLANLSSWLRSQGGRLVGTLPMLAAYLDEPCEPSPYSPASRLFWNEFYIDVERVPELEHCAAAKELLASAEFQRGIRELRSSELVDYRRLMALKRRVLELLSTDFHDRKPARAAEFSRYVQENPQLDDYAQFSAVYERRREPWQQWPAELRSGRVGIEDYDERHAEYHRYVQWIANEQLESLAKDARAAGDGLYLDLPLGVRGDGYDVWRYQRDFALSATAGAPPDAVFTKGQDWGFAPLHPEGIRQSGYRHVRAYLANQMRFARTLRIDHVMSLHRLYWIPNGLTAADGVYVRYRADEFYAVLSVESHRNRTAIIGENLGTVPKAVDDALEQHGVRKMYVVQYEYESDNLESAAAAEPVVANAAPLKPVAAATIASINTHDMPMFAAWWAGEDVPDRVALGLMTDDEARKELASRDSIRRRTTQWLRREGMLAADVDSNDEPKAVLFAILKYLAASPTESLLINLEDLWLERRPQNTPSTSSERPNWRRKASRTLDELRDDRVLTKLFSEIAELRKDRRQTADKLPQAVAAKE